MDLLCKNISKNNCMNVIPLKYAISNSNEEAQLEFKGQKFSAEAITKEYIREILSKKGLNHFDVIKMDIEGAETFALNVLSDFLKSTRIIQIELHGTKEEVDKILAPFGFNFRRIKRNNYLNAALKFAVLHPVQALKLWKVFKDTKENPGVEKMLKGIEISNSENLMVGIYTRNS